MSLDLLSSLLKVLQALKRNLAIAHPPSLIENLLLTYFNAITLRFLSSSSLQICTLSQKIIQYILWNYSRVEDISDYRTKLYKIYGSFQD